MSCSCWPALHKWSASSQIKSVIPLDKMNRWNDLVQLFQQGHKDEGSLCTSNSVNPLSSMTALLWMFNILTLQTHMFNGSCCCKKTHPRGQCCFFLFEESARGTGFYNSLTLHGYHHLSTTFTLPSLFITGDLTTPNFPYHTVQQAQPYTLQQGCST
jgi:hypothetical protein